MNYKILVLICLTGSLLRNAEVSAQPDYIFKNPTLLSGTDLTEGAQYRFANVKTGVDAILTISYISPNAQLVAIDYFGGYDEALETKICILRSSIGHAEFDIQFVQSGTLIPLIQPHVPAAAIDIDGQQTGGLPLYEFDELNLNVDNNGQRVDYLLTGTDISVSTSGNWIKGLSTVAAPKPGIDITALSAMFVVQNNHISSLKYRVGVENYTEQSEIRLKSLYFKDIIGIVLPVSVQLKGHTASNKTVLEWTIDDADAINKVFLERSNEEKNFVAIKEYEPNSITYHYQESLAENKNTWYRLRIELHDGKSILSNILRFENKVSGLVNRLVVFPNPIVSTSTISIFSEKDQPGEISFYDMNGRAIKEKYKLNLSKGWNQLSLNEITSLPTGMFTVMLFIKNNLLRSKIVKQRK